MRGTEIRENTEVWKYHGVPVLLFIRKDIKDYTEGGEEGMREPLC